MCLVRNSNWKIEKVSLVDLMCHNKSMKKTSKRKVLDIKNRKIILLKRIAKAQKKDPIGDGTVGDAI